MGNFMGRLGLLCLLGIMIGVLSFGGAKLATASGLSPAAPAHSILHQPARVWRDCQRIARCSGCAPVYHCRSCSYQRQCRNGLCEWGDVCVWGPYLPLAPKGVPVY